MRLPVPPRRPRRILASLKEGLAQSADLESFCLELAKRFRVRRTEVALLHLEPGLLKFIFPEQLRIAGSLPVSSATAVAGHTVNTKKAEPFNSLAKVTRATIFRKRETGFR